MLNQVKGERSIGTHLKFLSDQKNAIISFKFFQSFFSVNFFKHTQLFIHPNYQFKNG